MQQFNYHLLCLARDAREFTQAGLARAMNMSQGTLSKYETGLLTPPENVVQQLSAVLKFPVSFFLQPEQPYGFPPFHFRKRKKLGTRALNRIIAEMNICRMHVKRLRISYEHEESGFIPEIDPDQYQGISKRSPNIEEIAQHVREAWHVGAGPIDNMVGLIERNGGIVIPCAFGTDLIDAMSQRIDGMPVLFFVNKTAPADRVRYTLAHELGHMILHTLSLRDDDAMEEEADAFAGAFLLPAADFRAQLRRFDLAHVANLKAYWKISMGAIAMRAARLNLISGNQSKVFWMQMNTFGYRKHEPNEPAPESPESLLRMVQFHRQALRYSESDVAALLHLNVDDFRVLYGEAVLLRRTIAAPRLRLVK